MVTGPTVAALTRNAIWVEALPLWRAASNTDPRRLAEIQATDTLEALQQS